MKENEEKIIYKVFKGVLFLKIFNSIWEISLALVILFDRKFKDAIFLILGKELSERPNNFLASHLMNQLGNITHATEIYIGIYFLLQGFIKILLIVGLLKKKIWVYPLSIYIFLILIVYQLYRFNLHHFHNPIFILISTLDVITILLINHEYKELKK